MAQAADRPGTFRAVIEGYGVFLASKDGSKSQGVNIRVRLTALWHEDEWHPWEEFDREAFGRIFVVGKGGEVLTEAASSLAKNAGWNYQEWLDGTWKPTPCQVKIEPDTFEKAQHPFKVSYVNGFDDVPGSGFGAIDPAKAKALSSRYGSQFRALLGSVAANAKPAPAGAPAAPKKAPTKPAPPGELPATDPDVPF